MKSFDFYWKLTRPHTLPASIIPAAAGICFAIYADGAFKFLVALAMVLCATLIQIATNLFNEYYDYKNGLDTEESVGIGGAIVHDGVSPKSILVSALAIYGICGLLGIYLAYASSWALIPIGGICLIIGYCYTGGPFPISRSPFGELFAGTLMGTGYFLISYFTQTGHVTWLAFAMSLPLNFLIGLLLTANSLRDRVADAANGRKTLAILLGHEYTLVFMAAGFTLSYFWLIVLLFFGQSPLILLPILSAPYAVSCIHAYENAQQTPKKMMKGMMYCSKTNKYFGILYCVAILLQAVLALIF